MTHPMLQGGARIHRSLVAFAALGFYTGKVVRRRDARFRRVIENARLPLHLSDSAISADAE